MFGGDEYNLDLKIRGVKYQVNIDEYTDMIYSQTKNCSIGNKDEYQKIDIKNIKIIENPYKKTINFIKFNSIKDERGDYKDYKEDDHCAVLIIDFEKKNQQYNH